MRGAISPHPECVFMACYLVKHTDNFTSLYLYHSGLRGYIQKFSDWVVNDITTQRVIAAKLTRLTHKTAIQLRLVAESYTICSSRSRRPVRKLMDTTSSQYSWNLKLQLLFEIFILIWLIFNEIQREIISGSIQRDICSAIVFATVEVCICDKWGMQNDKRNI
jgi:hypothetical protein